jgi:hypothetical protein
MIGKDQIQSLLANKERKSLDGKAQTLIQAALNGGGKDNVTVGLISFSGTTKEPTVEVTQERPSKSFFSRIQKPILILLLVLASIFAAIRFWKANEPNEPNDTEISKEQGKKGSSDQTTTEEATKETTIEADDSIAAKDKAAADAKVEKDKAAAEKEAKEADSIKRLKNTKLGTPTPPNGI